jgi:hypothetical protein
MLCPSSEFFLLEMDANTITHDLAISSNTNSSRINGSTGSIGGSGNMRRAHVPMAAHVRLRTDWKNFGVQRKTTKLTSMIGVTRTQTWVTAGRILGKPHWQEVIIICLEGEQRCKK